jgi:hypothetical protein
MDIQISFNELSSESLNSRIRRVYLILPETVEVSELSEKEIINAIMKVFDRQMLIASTIPDGVNFKVSQNGRVKFHGHIKASGEINVLSTEQ